jgi:hypothetical protein
MLLASRPEERDMRYLIPMALLLVLAGCASWDWRAAGRSLLQSTCYSIGNCASPCAIGDDPDNACQ